MEKYFERILISATHKFYHNFDFLKRVSPHSFNSIENKRFGSYEFL